MHNFTDVHLKYMYLHNLHIYVTVILYIHKYLFLDFNHIMYWAHLINVVIVPWIFGVEFQLSLPLCIMLTGAIYNVIVLRCAASSIY